MIASAFALVQPFLPLITIVSFALALISLVLVPVLIIYMPADYFLAAHRMRRRGYTAHGLTLARNILAFVLLIAGVLMLVLPGQGLLTIFVALLMSDMPGKYRLERWLVLKPGVLRTINWVRRKYNKTPVKAPPRGANRGTFKRRQ